MPQLSIVVVGPPQARALDRLAARVRRSGAGVEIVPAGAYGDDPTGLAGALAAATGEWAIVLDGSRPPPPDGLRRLRDFVEQCDDPSLALIALDAPPAAATAVPGGVARLALDRLPTLPPLPAACVRRVPLATAAAVCDPRVRPGFAGTALLLRCLLAGADRSAAWLGGGYAAAGAPTAAPAWHLPATYIEAVEAGPLALVETARAAHGRMPAWLQRAVLDELCLYFTADMQPRSPTATVSEDTAAAFHGLVRRILAHVDADAVGQLDVAAVDADVRHALMSYLPRAGSVGEVAVVGLDADQGLARLSYHIHGRPPTEAFLLDGRAVTPAWAKYRSCRFFRRTLCRERIVWTPLDGARTLAVRLDGAPVALSVGRRPLDVVAPRVSAGDGVVVDAVRAAFAPGTVAAPAGPAALKARALRWLARRWFARRRYARAWVFVDRDDDADDNAEHQYRWTRRHHPGINAWFLLDRTSPHWERLQREGFRLMPPGLSRKLLMLNAEHLLSSQPLPHAGFDPALHGGTLPWRFTFLQHGVIMNDLSHWLNGQPFDVFITSSPAEECAIGGDDTPYTYTAREVRRTGLPRHDQLLELAAGLPAQGVDTILLMPTWRSRLSGQGTDARARAAFRDSDYARSWRALLGCEALRQVAARHGKRIVFMPHPDSAPFVDAFDAPAHVEVATKAATGIQPLFARSAAMVTDYSSVAFEMAFLRRPVVYFQFDRDTFFAGGHNWREGYFDFERDGFGPVTTAPDEVAQALDRLLAPDAAALAGYVERMERTLPDRNGGACRRVHEAVTGIRRRHAASVPGHCAAAAPGAAADADKASFARMPTHPAR